MSINPVVLFMLFISIKILHPDLKPKEVLGPKPKEVLFFPRGPPAGRPRGARGWPADEFCYFDGIAKFFFG